MKSYIYSCSDDRNDRFNRKRDRRAHEQEQGTTEETSARAEACAHTNISVFPCALRKYRHMSSPLASTSVTTLPAAGAPSSTMAIIRSCRAEKRSIPWHDHMEPISHFEPVQFVFELEDTLAGVA